ncbi:MAG: ornithine--oxo-acid transaminase [Candidatus Paceibacterota bacterium]
MTTEEHLALCYYFSAHNYKPLENVFKKSSGIWVWDKDGNKYMDCLSAYSACNAGHRNWRITIPVALHILFGTDTLSRAFVHAEEGPFSAELARFCGKDRSLVKNAGVESVETAIKGARRWGYANKDIKEEKGEVAEIIVARNNFHGRTIAALSASTEAAYKRGFGPFVPGFVPVPFGDSEALYNAITKNTVAVMIEPIQGEAGVIIPSDGYLQDVRDICDDKKILMIADEIQVGLGRTGKRFACDWENVVPDIYIIGKALGGNLIPVSAIVANDDIMDYFDPGSDGSTFGLNPLACVAGRAYLRTFEKLHLAERSAELGEYFMAELRKIKSPYVTEVRGRGLLIGVELNTKARPFCEALMKEGLLCKETHDMVIRFAPPLVITKKEIDWAIQRIKKVLEAVNIFDI